jgi:hypothetical protein
MTWPSCAYAPAIATTQDATLAESLLIARVRNIPRVPESDV